MKAYMLYEGDEWLSTDSLVCLGVFTRIDKLKSAIYKMSRFYVNIGCFDIDDDCDIKSFCSHVRDEVIETGQYRGLKASFLVKEIELNKLDEI